MAFDPFLLPPPPVFSEEASFSVPGSDSRLTLSLRIVPGVAFDMRRQEAEEQLIAEYVHGGKLLHSPGQPPLPLPRDLCRYIALLMTCQVQPEAGTSIEGAGREERPALRMGSVDEEALSWKPYSAEQWAALAMRAEDTFWSVLAMCNILLARATGGRALRLQVAVAYQLLPPPLEREDDLVSPDRSGYSEASELREEEVSATIDASGNARGTQDLLGAPEDSPAPVAAS